VGTTAGLDAVRKCMKNLIFSYFVGMRVQFLAKRLAISEK